MASLKELVLRMVADGELTSAQALAFIQKLGTARLAAAPVRPADGAAEPLDIAVTGLSVRVAGANGTEQFWDLLAQGTVAIGEVPSDRWSASRLYDPTGARPNSTSCKWGGFLPDVDRFDPLFFNISPREADRMDPQQRLFLEEAWKALEDAGYPDRVLDGRRCGVFVGTGAGDYVHRIAAANAQVDGYAFMGNAPSILASRIAYLLNLKGPCVALDTACSSSLVAIHLACESLSRGTCDVALAGGVCVLMTPNFFVAASKSGMLSRSGQLRAFDNAADGFVPGEGVAALVLKPLAHALRDGDRIHGVIKGSGINQDGRTNGITAPNAASQASLEAEVYRRSGISPETLGYIETHGTGTRLGDPIEVEALTQAFRQFTDVKQHCALGSVKASIGHTMTAAGAVSVIKVLLALQHGKLPPSANFAVPNDAIRFEDSPFYVNTRLSEWRPPAGMPRRAGVSSFGFSGTNAHVVIEEAPPRVSRPAPGASPYRLVTLSARTDSALRARGAALREWLASGEPVNLGALSYTLNARRTHFERRTAFVAAEPADLAAQLELWLASGSASAPHVMEAAPAELKALAEHYQARQPIEWQALYAKEPHEVIPLPAYPFERRSCGVDRHPGQGRVSRPEALHALLDAVIPSVEGATFRTAFAREDELLRDHVVRGRSILPGVVYLEMARAACASFEGAPGVAKLRDVVWLKPLVVEDQLETRLRLKPRGASMAFEVVSGGAGEAESRHCRGELVLGTPALAEERLELAAIKGRCQRRIERDWLYQRFSSSGVVCGPFCRGLQDVWWNAEGEGEAIARLALPPEAEGSLGNFVLHPTLLDAAFQTAMALLVSRQPAGAASLMVPFSTGEVTFSGALPRRCWVHVKALSSEGAPGVARFQLVLCDDEGRVRVRLDDFVAREFTASSERPASAAPVREAGEPAPISRDTLAFFRPVWRRAAVPPLRSEGGTPGTVLILRRDTEPSLSAALHRVHAGQRVVEAWLGRGQEGPVGSIHLDCRRQADFEALLGRVGPVSTAYFLGGLADTGPEARNALDVHAVDEAQEHGVMSLLRLVRALSAVQPGRALGLYVVTQSVQHVLPGEPILPLAGGLIGLTKAISREYPHYRVRCVDVDGEALRSAPDSVARALRDEPEPVPGAELAYRGGYRFERALERVLLPPGPPEQVPLRERGVYLILGGAGGIGLELCRRLAARVRARLVLVGRSALDERRRQVLREVEAAGGEVEYFQADATDLQAMRDVVARAVGKWGRVDGAIHSAIVLKDRALELMDEPTFRTVLDAKARTSVVLAAALAEQPLDFLAFFSSANALFGNAGQANYAAACTFKDAFALHLRQSGRRVRVFNWGYWGGTGIVASPEYRARLARQGVGSIEAMEGMDAFEQVLAAPLEQVMPMKVDAAVLSASGVDLSSVVESLPVLEAPVIAEVASTVGSSVGREEEWRALETAAESFREVQRYGREGLARTFRTLGGLGGAGRRLRLDEVRATLGLVPRYERLLRALLDMLEREGVLEREGDHWRVTRTVEDAEWLRRLDGLPARGRQLSERFPDMAPFIGLLDACLERYGEILAGRVPANDVLFPNSSMERVERLYKGNRMADPYNRVLSGCVRAAVEARLRQRPSGQVRLIELGAGTGGTTAFVLEQLKPWADRITLHYTDLSAGFLRFGERTFGKSGFLRFGLLDLEKDVGAQGFTPGSFDVAYASNVLHATRDIRQTLRNAKRLLRHGGLLVFNEITRVEDFATLTFGLTDGWWRYEDGAVRLPHAPLLGVPEWTAILREEGLAPVHVFGRPGLAAPELGQAVILSASDGCFPRGERVTAAPARPAPSPVQVPAPVRRARADEDRVSTLETRIRELVAGAVGLSPSEVDPSRRFMEYGVDSIIGVELVNRLNEELGLSLRTTVFFDYSGAAELARFIAAESQPAEPSRPSEAAPTVRPPPAPAQDGALDTLLRQLAAGAVSVEDALSATALRRGKGTDHGA